MRLSSHLAVPVRPFWVFFGPSPTLETFHTHTHTHTLPTTTATAAMGGNIDVTNFLPPPPQPFSPSVSHLQFFSSSNYFLTTGEIVGRLTLKDYKPLCASIFLTPLSYIVCRCLIVSWKGLDFTNICEICRSKNKMHVTSPFHTR